VARSDIKWINPFELLEMGKMKVPFFYEHKEPLETWDTFYQAFAKVYGAQVSQGPLHRKEGFTWFFLTEHEPWMSLGKTALTYGYTSVIRMHRSFRAEPRQMALQFDENDSLKNAVIEANCRLQSQAEETAELRKKVESLKKAKDGLLDCVARHQRLELGLKKAVGMHEAGNLLFSEEYRGRVAATAADSFDVVFDDGEGDTFVQTYTKQQTQGAKPPQEGDWVYVFAAVYSYEPRRVSLRQIMSDK
jgi:hypothetical protein